MKKLFLLAPLFLIYSTVNCMHGTSYVEQGPIPARKLHIPNLLQEHSPTFNFVRDAITLIDTHERKLAEVRYSVAPLPVAIGFSSFLAGTIAAAIFKKTWKRSICCGLVCCGLGVLLGKYLRRRELRNCINNFDVQADNYAQDWARQEPNPQLIRFNNQNYGLLQAIDVAPSMAEIRKSTTKELKKIIEKTNRKRLQRNPQAIIPPRIQPNLIFNFEAEQLALVRQASELAKQLTGQQNDHDAQLRRQIAHLSEEYHRNHPAVIITVDGTNYNFREAIRLFPKAAERELGISTTGPNHYFGGVGLLFPDAIQRPAPPTEQQPIEGSTT